MQISWRASTRSVWTGLKAIVYTVSHGRTAVYLSDDCYSGIAKVGRRLRSADARTRTQFGDRNYAVHAGSRMWNSLYRLHCMTLTVSTASESRWRLICLVAAAAHTLTYLCRVYTRTPVFQITSKWAYLRPRKMLHTSKFWSVYGRKN